MVTKTNGASPDRRRKYDAAFKAEALRLAGESRGAAARHQPQAALPLAVGVLTPGFLQYLAHRPVRPPRHFLQKRNAVHKLKHRQPRRVAHTAERFQRRHLVFDRPLPRRHGTAQRPDLISRGFFMPTPYLATP